MMLVRLFSPYVTRKGHQFNQLVAFHVTPLIKQCITLTCSLLPNLEAQIVSIQPSKCSFMAIPHGLLRRVHPSLATPPLMLLWTGQEHIGATCAFYRGDVTVLSTGCCLFAADHTANDLFTARISLHHPIPLFSFPGFRVWLMLHRRMPFFTAVDADTLSCLLHANRQDSAE